MRIRRRSDFICGGRELAVRANAPEIARQVAAEFAERLQAASPWQQFWLRIAMQREIARRVKAVAPRHALY
ncbi:MAG: hypothetical protein CMJ58_14730 [Planctomycetaceae bacterium]|nr:hypothetical protein [Planctomycetaceae bacterium]